MIRNADAAMYRAKEKGRDGFEFFTPDLNARASDRRAFEIELEGAVERGEMTIAFQPIVEAESRTLRGVEALARWSTSERNSIPPAEFIPVAEDMGLITALGRRIRKAACLHAMSWRRRSSSPLYLSVNVSAIELQHPRFVGSIERLLDEIGYPADELCLEISELAGGGKLDACLSTFEALRDSGIGIAIDDFGTGGSCLDILRKFPFDALKIDLSLVQGIPGAPRDAAIVKSVIRLGHVLGARVVAEGVERAEQLDFLRYHRCDEVQGNLLGPPVRSDEFAERWRA